MVGRILAKQRTRWLRNIVWERDVMKIIYQEEKARLASDTEQTHESSVYVLPYTGLVRAIVPRGINAQEPGRFYGYAGFLKSFIAKRCKLNNGIFMVILRGVYDIITAETILYMKKEFSQIKLICIEPYVGYFLKRASKI